MREIKFIAWNIEEERMYEPLDIFDSCYGGERDELVLMQYAGLKDKNGKEIYEGDILKYLGKDSRNEKNYHTRVVVWKESSGAWRMKKITGDDNDFFKKKYRAHFSERSQEKHEVIGNIYENPELLK